MKPRPTPAAALLLAALLSACASPPPTEHAKPGAEDRAAITAVVQDVFDAIATNDPQAWQEHLAEGGVMHFVQGGPGGRVVGARSFAEQIASADGTAINACEEWWDPTILVDGDIATVWTPYEFFLDGEFSHAGTDVFVLLRTDDGWKISSLAWTVEPKRRR